MIYDYMNSFLLPEMYDEVRKEQKLKNLSLEEVEELEEKRDHFILGQFYFSGIEVAYKRSKKTPNTS